jgi:hypothetical protein
MKYLVALLCMVFVLASNIASMPASEDATWIADYNHDAPIIVSNFELASNHMSNLTSANEPTDDMVSAKNIWKINK